jgi:hypothetical protein
VSERKLMMGVASTCWICLLCALLASVPSYKLLQSRRVNSAEMLSLTGNSLEAKEVMTKGATVSKTDTLQRFVIAVRCRLQVMSAALIIVS